jgi:hypothetical protein
MEYFGTSYHKENAKKALQKALQKIKENKKKRIEEYLKNPKRCKQCNNKLSYAERFKTFCNRVCSAKFNNISRNHTEITKKKISKSIKKYYTNTLKKDRKRFPKKFYSIKFKNCKVCGTLFIIRSGIKRSPKWEKKTCSVKCGVIASTKLRTYPNGRKKLLWYENPYQGKVLLESSWEKIIADILCEKKIKWIRPEPIEWIDLKNKQRLYYPDFYLVDYDIYLDPKNPFCMKQDEEKMSNISKKIHVIYGDIEIVKKFVDNLIIL